MGKGLLIALSIAIAVLAIALAMEPYLLNALGMEKTVTQTFVSTKLSIITVTKPVTIEKTLTRVLTTAITKPTTVFITKTLERTTTSIEILTKTKLITTTLETTLVKPTTITYTKTMVSTITTTKTMTTKLLETITKTTTITKTIEKNAVLEAIKGSISDLKAFYAKADAIIAKWIARANSSIYIAIHKCMIGRVFGSCSIGDCEERHCSEGRLSNHGTRYNG